MNRLLVLAPVVLFCTGAHAADPVSIIGITEHDGMLAATIVNGHPAALTGLLIEATTYSKGKPKLRAIRYLDVYVNAFHDKAIAPREQRTFPLVDAHLARMSPPSIVISAAVFADGHRFGSEEGTRILVGRRKAAQDAIDRFRSILVSVKGGDLTTVRSRVEDLAQRQASESKAAMQEDVPILAAGSQIADWVKGAFAGAPSECSVECAMIRAEYVLGGLTQWREQVRRGLVDLGER